MRGVSSVLSLFRNGFNKYNIVRFYLSVLWTFAIDILDAFFGSRYITYGVAFHQSLHRLLWYNVQGQNYIGI